MRIFDLFNWMRERHAIYERRQQGLPKPWTDDPILQNYRFCNVYRELDTVTRWIAKNWREPNASDPDVWFAMAVARFVNWPDTLAELGYPVPWTDEMAQKFIHVLSDRKEAGEKVFTGAYVIHAGNKGGSKIGHLVYDIFTPLWERSSYNSDPEHGKIKPIADWSISCATFNKKLMEFEGFGSFMAGQVVCDTKYTKLLNTAADWWSFACPGPGSRRGLARVCGLPVAYNWGDTEWSAALEDVRMKVEPYVLSSRMPPVHAQDLQNCLCEFDKYERVRLGQGRPRSKYSGS